MVAPVEVLGPGEDSVAAKVAELAAASVEEPAEVRAVDSAEAQVAVPVVAWAAGWEAAVGPAAEEGLEEEVVADFSKFA